MTENGFTEQQAKALAKEQVQLLNNNLATKVDLQTVKTELEAKIEAAKVDLSKWMVKAMIAQGTLIAALVKLL